jgi:hypothetical protein
VSAGTLPSGGVAAAKRWAFDEETKLYVGSVPGVPGAHT